MNIKFLKSCMFKGKIITNATEGLKKNTESWVSNITELGYLNP